MSHVDHVIYTRHSKKISSNSSFSLAWPWPIHWPIHDFDFNKRLILIHSKTLHDLKRIDKVV